MGFDASKGDVGIEGINLDPQSLHLIFVHASKLADICCQWKVDSMVEMIAMNQSQWWKKNFCVKWEWKGFNRMKTKYVN